MSDMKKVRVAVIGAGPSGLAAIKCCLDEGIDPTCFERTDDIGGLWNWQEKPTDGRSTVMKSTVINSSKEMSFYSDFPVPDDYPNYMHNTKVLNYFRLYAENFHLTEHIQFCTEVTRVSQAENFSETGRWVLELKNVKLGKKWKEEFDGVLICSGHHAEKKMPHFVEQEEFEGKIIHSHDYSHFQGYEGKRVIVVGIGNSGVDVTVDLSKICNQVYLSTRRGGWILRRVSEKGVPFDIPFNYRFMRFLSQLLPFSVVNSLMERKVNADFDHEMYGLKPSHRFFSVHPTMGDDLPNRLIAGYVIMKPDIRRLGKRSVEFEDGSVVEDVDAIICSTGYLFGFPFIDHEALRVHDNVVNLYKYVFPPDVFPATMAVIGCLQPLGALMPISEMQCRWATRILKGNLKLPSSENMWKDIRMKREQVSKQYLPSTRHTMQVDYMSFMDELAQLCGCKPNIARLFFTDPKLALSVAFGPAAPYQYRLMGHGAWPGARQATLTIMDRVRYPLSTRKSANSKGSVSSRILFIGVLVVLLSAILLSHCWA